LDEGVEVGGAESDVPAEFVEGDASFGDEPSDEPG